MTCDIENPGPGQGQAQKCGRVILVNVCYLLLKTISTYYLYIYRYFKQQVSWNHSTIKIADEVPRDDNITINTVYFTAGLENTFKQNEAEDTSLR